MRGSICNFRVLAGITLLARTGFPYAQEVGTGDGLEQITVTAQKRDQNLQAVGTSITALDATALSKLGLTDVTSVASQTPAMQFNQYSPNITVYNLRGVSQNDFSDHQEAPIAVYSDDVYVASMGALAGAMYDLARVEILRGPQGTLFGRNATGGLIQYISEKPKFGEAGSISVTAGTYSTVNSEGFVNAALNESLAARFSFATDYHSGYVENRIGPDLGNQNPICRATAVAIRAQRRRRNSAEALRPRQQSRNGCGVFLGSGAPRCHGSSSRDRPNQHRQLSIHLRWLHARR